MWSVAAIMMLVAVSSSGTTLGGTDTRVGQPGTDQTQEWGVWAEPAVEPPSVEDDERPAPVTRLRRRRRKRIRPYNQGVLSNADYEEQPAPLRPSRQRFGSEDEHEPLLLPEDRPYRARPRRRRLKPRQRLPTLREETLFDGRQEVPWREDDAYHGSGHHTRHSVLEEEYVPVPRARGRKRRPVQELYVDYPASEPGLTQHVSRESSHNSKEVMIYGDDPVFPLTSSSITQENERTEQPSTMRQPDIHHHKETVSTNTERVNTFRPSKPRRLTSPPPPSTTLRADTRVVYDTLSRTRVNAQRLYISSTSASPVELAGMDDQLLPFLPTNNNSETKLIALNTPVTVVPGSPGTGDGLNEHIRHITKETPQKVETHVGELTSLVPEPWPQSTLPGSGEIKSKTSGQHTVSRQHITNLHPNKLALQPPPLDVQEFSDIDPIQRSQEFNTRHSSPPTTLPPPVRIKLDPRIKSIEELIQKTRQSLQPSLGIHVPNSTHEDEPMKKTIPLSTPLPTTSTFNSTKELVEGEEPMKPQPHHSQDKIQELLQSEHRQTKMTAPSTTQPATTTVKVREHPDGEESAGLQLQQPRDEILELLRSEDGSNRLARILQSRNMTLEELLAHRERGSSQQHLSDIFSTSGTPITPTPRPNCTSQQSTHYPSSSSPDGIDHSTRTPLAAKLFEQTSRRTSRMFTTPKTARSTDKHHDRDKYSPIWKILKPHSIGIHLEASNHQEEAVDTSYKKVDLDDDSSSLYGETAGKVDKVLTNDPAVNFVEVEGEQKYQHEDTASENIVLGGFSVPVRSGIIASCAILLVTVLVFVGILVGCRWRQRRARRRYVEGIVGARERSTSLDELRGKRAGRSLTPVLVGARDLYGRAPENRRYYLWATIRKTLRYK